MRYTLIYRFCRFLTVLDGRSGKDIRRITGLPRAVMQRYLVTAKALGVEVAYSRKTKRYSIINSGPFDISAMAMLALDGKQSKVVPLDQFWRRAA